MSSILVTGGAGFIGSAVVRQLLQSTADKVLVVDALTYAGCRTNLPKHPGWSSFTRISATSVRCSG